MKSLRCGVLVGSLLLALPVFAQSEPEQEFVDKQFLSNVLVREGLGGEKILLRGRGIFLNGQNLSLKEFLASYESEDPAEKAAAYTFILGAVDATEGKLWCSYHKFKTVTLLETIHFGLKKLDSSRHNERAAHVIVEMLEKRYPCKNER